MYQSAATRSSASLHAAMFEGKPCQAWHRQPQRTGCCLQTCAANAEEKLRTNCARCLQDMMKSLGVQEDLVYNQKALEAEWSELRGHKMLTHCQSNELAELWMCFDRDLQSMDCPANLARRCSRGIELPSPPDDAGTQSVESARQSLGQLKQLAWGSPVAAPIRTADA